MADHIVVPVHRSILCGLGMSPRCWRAFRSGETLARTGKSFPIIAIQEAGLDGFWLHRVLEREGLESHIVDPASIATSRRRRRAKTERIDGETLLRALLAHNRGEPRVCAMVRVPTPEEEDRRRLCRERKVLNAERVEHVNRIKLGLLPCFLPGNGSRLVARPTSLARIPVSPVPTVSGIVKALRLPACASPVAYQFRSGVGAILCSSCSPWRRFRLGEGPIRARAFGQPAAHCRRCLVRTPAGSHRFPGDPPPESETPLDRRPPQA